MMTLYTVSLKFEELVKENPRSVVQALKAFDFVTVVDEDDYPNVTAQIPEDRVREVRRALGAFTHLEQMQTLNLL